MKKKVLSIAIGATLAVAGCGYEEAEAPIQPTPKEPTATTTPEQPEPEETGDAAEKQNARTLIACETLVGSDGLLETIPGLLIEMPEVLDDSNIDPYLLAYWSFESDRSFAPKDMLPHIDQLAAPFDDIYDAVYGDGDGQINTEMGDALVPSAEIMRQCVDVGYTISY